MFVNQHTSATADNFFMPTNLTFDTEVSINPNKNKINTFMNSCVSMQAQSELMQKIILCDQIQQENLIYRKSVQNDVKEFTVKKIPFFQFFFQLLHIYLLSNTYPLFGSCWGSKKSSVFMYMATLLLPRDKIYPGAETQGLVLPC